MSADETPRHLLPPPIVAHELSRLVHGLGLNGSPVSMFLHPWDQIVLAVARDPGDKGAAITDQLTQRDYTSRQVLDVFGAVQAENPVGPAPKVTYSGSTVFLTRDELEDLPPPHYIIDGLIQADSSVCLYGPTGLGKTLVALSMGLAIASGTPWFGRETRKGPVIHILGEGANDAKARIKAWEYAYNAGESVGPGFILVPTGLDLRDPLVVSDLLWGALSKIDEPPAMVIVDTLARNMRGNENDTTDMGAMVETFDTIWRKTGGAATVVHHTGKDDITIRGNTALPSGVGTLIALQGDEDSNDIRLVCEKQRNGPKFDPINLTRTPSLDSVTVTLASFQGDGGANKTRQRMRRILGCLARLDNQAGATAAQIKEQLAVEAASQKAQLYAVLENLLKQNCVSKTSSGRYNQVYRITDWGRGVLRTLEQESMRGGGGNMVE